MNSCQANWRAANREIVDVSADLEIMSVDVLELDDPAVSLEKDRNYNRDVVFINLILAALSCEGKTEVRLLLLSCTILMRPLALSRSARTCCSLILNLGLAVESRTLVNMTPRRRARGLMSD